MASSKFSFSAIKTILLATLVAGTLDIIAAITILGKMDAVRTLQYIASGVYGRAAFSGGETMAGYGLFFHYLITISFVVDYFMLYPLVPFLQKHKIAGGLLFGVFIWVVMNLLVLPFSNVPQSPFVWHSALVGASILMLAVGLPISLITHRYYQSLQKDQAF